MNGVAKNVYNGASSFGMFMAYVGLFIALIISGILFYNSYRIYSGDKEFQKSLNEGSAKIKEKRTGDKNATPTKNGWISYFIFGIIILLIGVGNFYLTYRFKFYAAASGVNTILGGSKKRKGRT
jgi:hypothetical protein